MHQNLNFRPAGGAYSAPPESLAGFRGPLRGRDGEEKKGEGKGRIIPPSTTPGSAPRVVSNVRKL